MGNTSSRNSADNFSDDSSRRLIDEARQDSLTNQQVCEVYKIVEEYRAKAGFPLDETVTLVSIYVELLAVGGIVDNEPDSAEVERVRKQVNFQCSGTVQAFGGIIGKTPTADDFIQELSRFVTVPAFLANAIRRTGR